MATDLAKKPNLDLSIIGSTGLPQYSGFIFDEWLAILQGPRGRRVFREMSDNDPIIGAILFSLEMLIRQVEWKIEPGADEKAFELISSAFEDMDRTWEDTMSEILTFLAEGFSVHEIIYKRRDGKNSKFDDGMIGWSSWPMRGQETTYRWEFDPAGNAVTYVQLGPPDWVMHEIPLEKCLHFRTTTRRNNPEGRSILRNAFTSWYEKKHIEQIEGIGIERDLAGLPVACVPSELLDVNAPAEVKAQRAQIEEIVTNIRRDQQEGVLWPLEYHDVHPLPTYELKLLSTGGQRQFNTDGIIARKDQRITMTTMADFLTLGHERVGSNAMAQEKGRLFVAAIGGWLSVIGSVINDSAIRRLLLLNGMDTVDPPRFVHGEIDRPDILMLGQYILSLSQAGMPLDYTPGGDLMQYLMDAAHLPAPPDYATYPLGASPDATDGTDGGSTYDDTPGTPAQTPTEDPKPAKKPAPTPARPKKPSTAKKKPFVPSGEANENNALILQIEALNAYRASREKTRETLEIAAQTRARGVRPTGSFGRAAAIPGRKK